MALPGLPESQVQTHGKPRKDHGSRRQGTGQGLLGILVFCGVVGWWWRLFMFM